MNEIVVDLARLRAVAASLGEIKIGASLYKWMAPASAVNDEQYFSAALFASSICHSTQGGLRGYFGGEYSKGWDYLWRAFLSASEVGMLTRNRLERLDQEELENILIRSADRGVVSLTDLDRRAGIIRELAIEIGATADGSVRKALGIDSLEVRAGGIGGLYSRLSDYTAFRDEQRKKSTCFIMTAHFSKRLTLVDPEAVDPMVDYHRIRLLLRTGILRAGADLAQRLRERRVIDITVARSLRDLAFESSKQLAELSPIDPLELDVILWSFARSACRNSPICVSNVFENKSFSLLTGFSKSSPCILNDACAGAVDSTYRGLWEPELRSEDY